MRIWALIAGLAVVSFVSRASFILAGNRWSLPPTVGRILRFAPAAALMAIIVPDLFRIDGVVTITVANPRVAAGVVAFTVAAVTRNILLTIVAGMGALLLAMYLVSASGP